MTAPDEELLKKYQSGDASGFEELIERYRGPLHTVIFRMVGERTDAEDIFQETFIRVLRHGGRFDFERRFSTWVYSIATNLCRDALRKRRRSPVLAAVEAEGTESGPDPEHDSFRGEVRAALDAALSKLPDEQREVFLLREYGGMSFKEIAGMTGANINTVLGRMHLAVKKLREELSGFREDMR